MLELQNLMKDFVGTPALAEARVILNRAGVAGAFAIASLSPNMVSAQARGTSTFQCEGSAAYVANSSLAGTQRSEWPIAFRMRVNRAEGTAMIFAVSGTTVIKPGSHRFAGDGRGLMALSWQWTDQADVSQPVTMTLTRAGEFKGVWSQTNPTRQAEALLGAFLGPEAASLVSVSARGNFSGVCWQ